MVNTSALPPNEVKVEATKKSDGMVNGAVLAIVIVLMLVALVIVLICVYNAKKKNKKFVGLT